MLADFLFPDLALPHQSCILYDRPLEMFRLRLLLCLKRCIELQWTPDAMLSLVLWTSLADFSWFSQQLPPFRVTVHDTATTLSAWIHSFCKHLNLCAHWLKAIIRVYNIWHAISAHYPRHAVMVVTARWFKCLANSEKYEL